MSCDGGLLKCKEEIVTCSLLLGNPRIASQESAKTILDSRLNRSEPIGESKEAQQSQNRLESGSQVQFEPADPEIHYVNRNNFAPSGPLHRRLRLHPSLHFTSNTPGIDCIDMLGKV